MNTMYGASENSLASAAEGIKSSLSRFLMPSASHWRMPCGPTRFGPTRDCMRAQTRRSSQLVTPASGATKTESTTNATTTIAIA